MAEPNNVFMVILLTALDTHRVREAVKRLLNAAMIDRMNSADCILFSGGAPGAEAAFGACAERHGVEEVNFTFEGHRMARHRGVRVLNHEELQAGDVSLEYVSRLMHRRYTDAPTIRRVLQTLWYQVNHGQEIYVIGAILDDGTVRGGTGWGAEFAKLCNKPLFVFDQEKDGWFQWTGERWEPRSAIGGAGCHPSALHRHGHAHARGQRQSRHRASVRAIVQELVSPQCRNWLFREHSRAIAVSARFTSISMASGLAICSPESAS